MVLLTATPQILEIIASLPAASLSLLDDPSNHLPADDSSPISHETVIAISRLPKNDGKPISLNTLLRGTKPYVPPPMPKPETSPEYKALMARLKADQERREYAALVAQSSDALEYVEGEEDNVSPSLVLNILLSVVLCAVAVFQLTKWWSNDGVRVLLSLATAIVVGISEVVVYAAYLRKVSEAKSKERSKKEKKILIGEYTDNDTGLEPSEQSISMANDGKEVIWGRGKHGGMRRRVRERWEKDQQKACEDEK